MKKKKRWGGSGGDWLQEHVNAPSHKAYLWLRSQRPSGKGLIAIAIRPQKPLPQLMTPLTIMEPTFWLIKALIKAHVGNNVDIYYGTIEIRAEFILTLGSRDGAHCGGNNPVLIVHQQRNLKRLCIRNRAPKNVNANSVITNGRSR